MVTPEWFTNEHSMKKKIRSEFNTGFCWGFCNGAARLVHKEEKKKYGAQL